jgi:hypothetical protein
MRAARGGSFGPAVLVAAAVALGAGGARAGEHPDFSGTFALDLAASDSLDALLKAQGASWLERQAAARASVTQVVRHRGDSLAITVKSSLGTRTNQVRIGGGWETKQGERGQARTRTDWAADGQSLVTRTELPQKKGPPVVLTVRRSLADGGRTTVQLLELRAQDGARYRARRILRRVAAKR